jgi:hypothetical protein
MKCEGETHGWKNLKGRGHLRTYFQVEKILYWLLRKRNAKMWTRIIRARMGDSDELQ